MLGLPVAAAAPPGILAVPLSVPLALAMVILALRILNLTDGELVHPAGVRV